MNWRIIAGIVVLAGLVGHHPEAFGQQAAKRRTEDAPGFWYKGTYVGRMPSRESLVSKKPTARNDRFIQQVSGQLTDELDTIEFDAPGAREIEAPAERIVAEDLGYSEQDYTIDDEPIHYPPPARRGGCVEPICRPFVGSGHNRFHAQAEYILFWTKGLDTPALATTSPDGTSAANAGVLGQDDTTILFGNDKLNNGGRSGGRFTLGYWYDDCEQNAIEATYLFLEDSSESFAADEGEYNILSRPFLNIVSAQQDARRIAFPGETEGTLNIHADTQFQTVEVLLRKAMFRHCDSRVDFLFGYRFAELEDQLRVDEFSRVLSGVNTGTTFDLYDQFETENSFHGIQFGLSSEWHPDDCWTVDLLAKIALGSNETDVTIAGETVQTPNGGGAVTSQGGLLAQPTNIGTYSEDRFGTVTELGVTLRRRIDRHMELSFGYSFILWTKVARAGDQIDTGLNQTQLLPGGLVGEGRPDFTGRASDFWAQGLRFGLVSRF